MRAKNTGEIIQIIKRCTRSLRHDRNFNPNLCYPIWKKLEDLTDGRSEVAASVLGNTTVKRLLPFLRHGYANALFALEKQWASDLLKETHCDLRSYPKYGQYRLRADFEMHMLRMLSIKLAKRIIVCGCGPFPVSAAVIKQHHRVSVDLLDRSRVAIDLASKLMRNAGLKTGTQFHCCDVRSFPKFGNYDVIFLAGSIGTSTDEKTTIVQDIAAKLRRGSFLVLREPMNLDKLLVADVDFDVLTGVDVVWFQIESTEDCVRRAFLRKA